jgi:hypothetical protein
MLGKYSTTGVKPLVLGFHVAQAGVELERLILLPQPPESHWNLPAAIS